MDTGRGQSVARGGQFREKEVLAARRRKTDPKVGAAGSHAP